jgi:hypothetical protein
VTLYGSQPIDDASKSDYFESLFYSQAIVGLNTSAFLEGAVVGRPVHTILLPEYHENQEGTLHFHYLFKVGGGVLQGARSFEEHWRQLGRSLRQPADQSRANASFVRAFIRPHGLDQPATSVFCDVVDDVLRNPAPAPEPTPFRFVLLQWAMSPALLLIRMVYGADVIRDDWTRKEQAHLRRRAESERAREVRRRAAATEKYERDERRAARIAARESAARETDAARVRIEAEKARYKHEKERQKAARQRSSYRAAMRARIKQGAHRLLGRWRPGRQTT